MTKDIEKNKGEDGKRINEFLVIEGKWRKEGNKFIYSGPTENATAPFGLSLFKYPLVSGSLKAKIKFKKKCIARLVIGYDARTKEYYSIGLGGYGFLYILDKFDASKGWQGLQVSGLESQIEEDVIYVVEVKVEGQRVRLIVNDVEVYDYRIPEPLRGTQTGLFGWGNGEVEFFDVSIKGSEKKAKAFVIMQFTEPYKSLYEEVIAKVCDEVGLFVYKADEVYTPGFILNDIINGIIESEIIIADISPVNANVFYELGFAHAFHKPTILLAQRGTQLPFDLSGFRVIFYDDSIKGKGEVEKNLRKHLRNIFD
jgi:hypothetical protein